MVLPFFSKDLQTEQSSFAFDWHSLDEEMRVGQSPDEIVMVYRGFAPDQLDPKEGMLSSALKAGRLEMIDEVIQGIAGKNTDPAISHIAHHTHGTAKALGLLTPYVSTTPYRDAAVHYASKPGEKVATLALRADQLIKVPLGPWEYLAIGSIPVTSIVAIENGAPLPEPKDQKENTTSLLSKYTAQFNSRAGKTSPSGSLMLDHDGLNLRAPSIDFPHISL